MSQRDSGVDELKRRMRAFNASKQETKPKTEGFATFLKYALYTAITLAVVFVGLALIKGILWLAHSM